MYPYWENRSTMSSSAFTTSEIELIDNLIQGDRNSFTIIYKKYWYKLYLIAYRKLKDREIAEELVQEIFVGLWEKRSNSGIQSLERYLVCAMKYAVIDHIRCQITRNKYLEYYRAFVETDQSETEELIAMNDLASSLEIGLNSLPDKSQEVFRLSRMESWPVYKIASHLHLSEKGVEYHITKSLKTLRIVLKDFVDCP
jgi:RNA polymerase sigma-70 factor (family 1)